ncbi:site-specific integrase [Streptomyces sp. NPDC060035]|uniref:site-specific integrase n=1 Tax=Streptomyces sp. NPDC060035 TaxID=3347044 RepID=UPI003690CFA5
MAGEWSLFWTGDGGGSASRVPGWEGLGERERALGFRGQQPILVSPEGRVDARLSEFFRRSRFASSALGTQESYVLDYRLFFTFLWQTGRNWDRARAEDLENWADWRLRGQGNDRLIGGAKWGRELAALRLLYEWAELRGHVESSPVRMRAVRSRAGEDVLVAELAPRDVRSSDVKWLTPRAYRLWRDVGLGGRALDGLEREGFRGRNDGRDMAFADVLFSTGVRRREGGTLLTAELPQVEGQRYYAMRIGRAVAKRAERYCYIGQAALRAAHGYRLSTRAQAVAVAQSRGTYERLAGLRIVEEIGQRGEVHWSGADGRMGRASLNELDDRQRMLLFSRTPQGLEPLMLWLTESGMPMGYRSWNRVFARASERCQRLGLGVYATPHMLRHSAALRMLVALHHALDRRLGLSPAERARYENVYGSVWSMVRDLLGHRSEDTTREIYLEPLRGLQLENLLNDEEHPDNTELLARLARSTGLVLDVAEPVSA